MQKFSDLMIDFETAGLDTRTAPVLQVGLLPFNRHEAEHPSAMLPRIMRIGFSLEAQVRDYGRVPDKNTLAWWDQQDSSVREVVFAGTEPLTALFERGFNPLIRDQLQYGFQIWANSPSFDLELVKSIAKAVGHPVPFMYRNERDVRTITNLLMKDTVQTPIKNLCDSLGLPGHDAGNDCVWQAQHVQTFHWILAQANLHNTLAVMEPAA